MTFGDAISPYGAIHTILASYNVTGHPTEPPRELLEHVRNHLPMWEVAGVRTFHHHPIVIFKNVDTGKVIAAMRGNLPLTFNNLFRGEFWHNYGRSFVNETIGPHGDFQGFLAGLTKDFGKIEFFASNSGGCCEIVTMNPPGDLFLYNGHIPKGHEFNDHTLAVRKTNDALTGSMVTRHRDQMPTIGRGGHGVEDAFKGGGGIWPCDSWSDVSRGRIPREPHEPFTGPIRQLDIGDGPKYQTSEELFQSVYKRLEREEFLAFRDQELRKIDIKRRDCPANAAKRIKKLDRVWLPDTRDPRDPNIKPGQPKDDVIRNELSEKAWKLVKSDPEFLEELAKMKELQSGGTRLVDPTVADPDASLREPAADEPTTSPEDPATDQLEEAPKEGNEGPPTTPSEEAMPGWLEGVGGTALSYGIWSTAFSFVIRCATYPLQKKKDKKPLGKMISASVKDGLGTSALASGAHVIGNGLARVGAFGARTVTDVFVPAVLTTVSGVTTVYSLSRTLYALANRPSCQTVVIPISAETRRALRPVEGRTVDDLSGITGAVLRKRRDDADTDQNLDDLIYKTLNEEYGAWN